MMLKINSLSFNFQEKALINNLSFELHSGKNLTILGENGAGKSTLAKLLCGLIPSKHAIMIDDTYIEKISTKNRASLINYMPSKFSLYDPYITVKEYLNLSLYKLTPPEDKLQDILSLLELKTYENDYAISLSSGEQQRLLLASTLIQSAQITIFDEPTSNLDPKRTKLIFNVLATSSYLKQKIVITHDLQLAYALNYPILYLSDGEAHYFEDSFFSTSNLQKYFDDTIMIVNNHIVQTL